MMEVVSTLVAWSLILVITILTPQKMTEAAITRAVQVLDVVMKEHIGIQRLKNVLSMRRIAHGNQTAMQMD